MPGNLLSHAPHRDIIVAVSPQPRAYTFAPAILQQRETGVHQRGESITFTWQGLKSVAERMDTSLGHSMPGHNCSQQVYDKALDQPLQSMDTSPSEDSSWTSLCSAQLPSQIYRGRSGQLLQVSWEPKPSLPPSYVCANWGLKLQAQTPNCSCWL